MSLIKTLKDKDGNILYPQSTAEAVFTKTGEKTVQDEIDNFNTVYFGSEAPTDEKAVLWIDSDAPATDVLTTTNRTVYTPIEDYNPATKKYTDDTVATGMEQIRTQYDILPAATAENNGKIIQYTGETTESLKKGNFYQLTPRYEKLFETDLEVITAVGDISNLGMPVGINSDYVANLDMQVLLSKIKEHDTTNILDTVEDYLICVIGGNAEYILINAIPLDAFNSQDMSKMINIEFSFADAADYGITLIEGTLSNESSPLLGYLNIPVITDDTQEPIRYEWLKIETDDFIEPIYFKAIIDNGLQPSAIGSESGILDYTPAEIDAIYYRLANAYKTNKTIYLVIENHYMPMAAEVEPSDGTYYDVSLYALTGLSYQSNKQFHAIFSTLSPLDSSAPYQIAIETNYRDFEQNTLLYYFVTSTPWMESNTYVKSFWTGTQAQYDKLSSKNKTTLYLIKEG